MKYLCHLLRSYPLSCILFAVIWYLCFFTPPHTKLDDIAFIDKWTHIIMYAGTCSVLWLEYVKRHTKADGRKLLLLAIIAPTLMSGLIEILQEYCTDGRRDGDWLDFAANTTGVLIGALLGLLWAKYRAIL